MTSFDIRKTWKNHLGNQRIDPLRIYEPRTIAEVQEIVRLAGERGVSVRAVGSGHSWSDVALTEGFLLKPTGMIRVPAPEPDFIRPEWADRRLVRAEGGTRVRELNAWLDRNGMGFANLGGYDGQTIAGVTSTSTHGSGIEFGPLNDQLRSLDVVVGDGSVQRIEPTDGPTDRAAFEAHHGAERTLIQDDHVWNGDRRRHGLHGRHLHGDDRGARALLHARGARAASLGEGPRRPRGRRRARAPRALRARLQPLRRRLSLSVSRHDARQHAKTRATAPGTSACATGSSRSRRCFRSRRSILNLLLDIAPKLAPLLLRGSVKSLVKDEYDEVSYKVFNIGTLNNLPAYSCEIGVPMDGRHIEAVETIFRVAAERRALGQVYQSSPIALRFVKASPAYLSMMNGRDTMMIELIGLNGNDGGIELLKAYEEALYALGGRPHWGHINTLSGSHGFVESMYPRLRRLARRARPAGPRAASSTARSRSASGCRPISSWCSASRLDVLYFGCPK